MTAGDGDVWTVATFAGETFDDPGSATVWCLRAGASAIAFAVLRRAADEASIVHLAVTPDRRRGGVGRELLRRVETVARSTGARALWLEVRASNAAARGLYERSGFEITQTRPGFYRSPVEAAVLMRRAL